MRTFRKRFSRSRRRRAFKKRRIPFKAKRTYRRRRYAKSKFRRSFIRRRYKYSGRRRSRRVKKQPIFYRDVNSQIFELHAANVTTNVNQGWHVSDRMAVFRASQVGAIAQTLLQLPATQGGFTPVQTGLQYRELEAFVSKIYGLLEFTNLGAFPINVEVYKVSPRRDIDASDMTSWDTAVSSTCTNNTTYTDAERLNSFAAGLLDVQKYGYSPLHFSEFTVRFKMRRVWANMMTAGSTARLPWKVPGFRFDRRLMGLLASGGVAIPKKSVAFMFHISGIPVGCKTTAPVVESCMPAPYKIGAILTTWWKMYSRFDEGYRTIYDAGQNWAVSGTAGPDTATFQWFNPDLAAAQPYSEAG